MTPTGITGRDIGAVGPAPRREAGAEGAPPRRLPGALRGAVLPARSAPSLRAGNQHAYIVDRRR